MSVQKSTFGLQCLPRPRYLYTSHDGATDCSFSDPNFSDPNFSDSSFSDSVSRGGQLVPGDSTAGEEVAERGTAEGDGCSGSLNFLSNISSTFFLIFCLTELAKNHKRVIVDIP